MKPLPRIQLSLSVTPEKEEKPRPGKFTYNGKDFAFSDKDLTDKKQIGQGAFGVVYSSIFIPLGVKIAVKSVGIHREDETNNILKEAHIMQKFNHPNLVTCYGYFRTLDQRKIKIALEYMDVGNLERLIAYKGHIPEEYTSFITRQILSGLECLHKKRCYHRDIKPPNILINSRGDVKIGDFGHLKQLEKTNETTSTGAGTFRYFSLERLQGQRYISNSDVWALGLVVLECVLGQFPMPITPKTVYGDLIVIVEKFDAKAYQDHVSPELRKFLSLCLTHNVTQRASADILLQTEFIRKHIGISSKDFMAWLNIKE